MITPDRRSLVPTEALEFPVDKAFRHYLFVLGLLARRQKPPASPAAAAIGLLVWLALLIIPRRSTGPSADQFMAGSLQRMVSGRSPISVRRSGRHAADSISTIAPTASVEAANEDDSRPAAAISLPAA